MAPDSTELNDSFMKKQLQKPDAENIMNRRSLSISKGEEKVLWIFTIDLEYSYGYLNWFEETNTYSVFSLIDGKSMLAI